MKITVIGLGSMGKRRIRNLKALGIRDIVGVDPRADRRRETARHFSIPTFAALKELPEVDAAIISTPPQHHAAALEWSIQRRIPTFMELNVLANDLPRLHRLARAAHVLVAPSSTMLFHPAIRFISSLMSSGKYGRATSFSYHVGQYLPDWHPWEHPDQFFVGRKETSGCWELVAFELNWIAHLFGLPQAIQMTKRKTIGFGFPFEDCFSVALGFKRCAGTLLVDVVSRFATRHLTLNFEKAQLRWDWEHPEVHVYSAKQKRWKIHPLPAPRAYAGYNKNISESMYVDELHAFLKAIRGKTPFPSHLGHDIAVLQKLRKG